MPSDEIKLRAAEIDRHIGARVRMRRSLLRMSQQTLADALGLTFQQVQKYEKGRNRIGASTLLAIADALMVTPAFFFQGLPQVGSPAADAAGELATRFFTLREGRELASDFLAIPHAADRAAIAGHVRLVANAFRATAMAEAAE